MMEARLLVEHDPAPAQGLSHPIFIRLQHQHVRQIDTNFYRLDAMARVLGHARLTPVLAGCQGVPAMGGAQGLKS